MTAPTSTPAEQIERFIERHPGQWWPSAPPDLGRIGGSETGKRLLLRWTILWVYPYRDGIEFAVTFGGGPAQVVPRDLLLGRLAEHEARHIIERGGEVEYLPVWLHDPVRRILRTRAGELLTLAGFSPADVVSAAETVDEALCKRPVVEVTGVLRALMAIGMSCRWATGANEAADDYVGFVSRRLDVVAEERDALAAKLAQVQAMQAAQEEYVTARMIAVRSVLRGVADEPRASQVTALDAADAYLVDALYRKPKTTETP